MATGRCTLSVHLKPRAKRDRVVSVDGDRLHIAVTAPPVDGKANEHLVKFLAKLLGVATSSCAIVRGEKSRDKVVAVEGLTIDEVRRRLLAEA